MMIIDVCKDSHSHAYLTTHNNTERSPVRMRTRIMLLAVVSPLLQSTPSPTGHSDFLCLPPLPLLQGIAPGTELHHERSGLAPYISQRLPEGSHGGS